MALARVKTWSAEILYYADLNAEFDSILNNPMSLISPFTANCDVDGYTITLDAAAVTTVVSSAAVSWNFTSGAKSGTPATTGSVANWSAQTFTDSATAGSGTAAVWTGFAIQRPTLAATNASVTTTAAATFYIINSPAAGTNQTITNAYAMWVDAGNARFDGSVFIGLVAAGDTAGVSIVAAGNIVSNAASSIPGSFNRLTDDGTIVQLRQDSTEEGTISVSGTTVSYNTFLGSHWAQLADGSKPDIPRGTVIASINALCEWPGEQNEKLPKVKISDAAGDARVYGVFLDWDDQPRDSGKLDENGERILVPQPTNDMYVAAVGTFLVRMQKGQPLKCGLVESAGDGTARFQDDQVHYRIGTLGKITAAVVVETYADGSFLMPCKLDAG